MPDNEVVDAEFTEKDAPLAVRQESAIAHAGLFGTDDPDVFIERATKAAAALAKVVRAQGWTKRLNKKNPDEEYVEIEGWQFLGGMVKVYASVQWTKQIDGGWEARAVCHDVYGNQLSSGEAQCTTAEWKWRDKDDFTRKGMAQTRACSRAYRGAIGFIMGLAGYKATPAAEMPDDDAPNGQAPPPKDEAPSLRELYATFLKTGRSEDEWRAFVASLFGQNAKVLLEGSADSRMRCFKEIARLRPVEKNAKTLDAQAEQANLELG